MYIVLSFLCGAMLSAAIQLRIGSKVIIVNTIALGLISVLFTYIIKPDGQIRHFHKYYYVNNDISDTADKSKGTEGYGNDTHPVGHKRDVEQGHSMVDSSSAQLVISDNEMSLQSKDMNSDMEEVDGKRKEELCMEDGGARQSGELEANNNQSGRQEDCNDEQPEDDLELVMINDKVVQVDIVHSEEQQAFANSVNRPTDTEESTSSPTKDPNSIPTATAGPLQADRSPLSGQIVAVLPLAHSSSLAPPSKAVETWTYSKTALSIYFLCMNAGFINATTLLDYRQLYTAHMTGYVLCIARVSYMV